MVRSVCRSGYATRSRLGTPTTGMRSACAITLAVVTPTRRPVKRPGPGAHRDGGEAVERDAALDPQVLDRGRQLLGVAPAAGELHRADHRTAVAERDRDLCRRRVEREEQHVSRPRPR